MGGLLLLLVLAWSLWPRTDEMSNTSAPLEPSTEEPASAALPEAKRATVPSPAEPEIAAEPQDAPELEPPSSASAAPTTPAPAPSEHEQGKKSVAAAKPSPALPAEGKAAGLRTGEKRSPSATSPSAPTPTSAGTEPVREPSEPVLRIVPAVQPAAPAGQDSRVPALSPK
jgi:hypothetical protein